jgi:8-oxo-dGTP pyrophosphatase MutT (NUDIX family)
MAVRVYYATEALPDDITCSVFVLAPPPGDGATAPPGAAAVAELAAAGFRGEVFVAAATDRSGPAGPADRQGWEDAALRRSDRILVYLPADGDGPWGSEAWGFWTARDPARLLVAADPGARQVQALLGRARRLGVPVYSTLREASLALAADTGQRRHGGECEVPLHVWRTEAFQTWYAAQRGAGNTLHGAAVEWVFRVGRGLVLYWALHVDVHVACEGRRKTNEVVISRPDVAAVVLYRPAPEYLDTEVVLVREYRATGATADGQIWEVPTGSWFQSGRDPLATALDEVEEEVGQRLPPEVVRPHAVRQVAGTVTAHRAHVFSAELSAEQIAEFRRREAANAVYGVAEESELTTIRVRTVRDLLTNTPSDWSVLGMILAVLWEGRAGPSVARPG